MSYIGANFTQQITTPAIDYFSGNGVTTTFTLSRPVTSIFSVEVIVNGVQQNPRTAYSINQAGNLVFDGAPNTGTNNIYVMYNSQVGQFVTPSPGTVGPSALAFGAVTASAMASGSVTTDAIAPGAVNNIDLDVASLTGTGAMIFPIGTTAQRPASPSVGMTRFNTNLNIVETWHGSLGWVALSNTFSASGGVESTYVASGISYKLHVFNSSGNFVVTSGSGQVEYLLVAGGGGGGQNAGAGGGAGGMLEGTFNVTPTSYPIVVGGGGAGGTISDVNTLAGGGTNSSVFGLTAIGGGGGTNSGGNGGNGGSGGGAGNYGAGNQSGGSGTAGQGNAGGAGTVPGGGDRTGGGGGGKNAAGQASQSTTLAGFGGDGKVNTITNSSVAYAGGGGGAPHNGTGGAGGAGGGGRGDNGGGSRIGGPGGTNLGGGGGAGSGGGFAGYAGGSGVVIIRYQI